MRKIYLQITLLLLMVGISSVNGNAQTVVNFSISQPAPPAAGFTYTNNGLNYSFTDGSGGNIVSWLWDFGDGGTDTTQNPTYTYTNEGTRVVCLTVTDGNGCTSTDCDTILLVGFNGPAPAFTFEVFPNPFEKEVELRYSLDRASKIGIEMLDLEGRLIWSRSEREEASGEYSVSLGKELANGIYLLRLSIDGVQYVERIVKQGK